MTRRGRGAAAYSSLGGGASAREQGGRAGRAQLGDRSLSWELTQPCESRLNAEVHNQSAPPDELPRQLLTTVNRADTSAAMMESILDSLTAEKLYPSATNLLDLEELSDGDFLTNVVSSARFLCPPVCGEASVGAPLLRPEIKRPSAAAPPGAGPEEGGAACTS